MATELRPKDSPDDRSQNMSPVRRQSCESALVDNHLHLFGGSDGSKCIPRNEIWITNICSHGDDSTTINKIFSSRRLKCACLRTRHLRLRYEEVLPLACKKKLSRLVTAIN